MSSLNILLLLSAIQMILNLVIPFLKLYLRYKVEDEPAAIAERATRTSSFKAYEISQILREYTLKSGQTKPAKINLIVEQK